MANTAVSNIVDLGSSPSAPVLTFKIPLTEGSPSWNGTGLENRRALNWPMRVRIPHPPPKMKDEGGRMKDETVAMLPE